MLTLKTILLALLFAIRITLCSANSVGQNEVDTSSYDVTRGSNILYYVESSLKKNQYLIPFIESELKAMRDQNDFQKRPLFNSVQSFDFLTSGDKINDTLISTYLTIHKDTEQHQHSEKEIEERKRIVEHLKDNQFFLKIDINVLNNLIEYQFVLYKIQTNPTNEFDYLELENYRTTSVFINPIEPDYKSKLKTALRQLIREANEPPVPTVYFKNKAVIDTIFTQVGEFTLNTSAADIDSPSDQLTYNWDVGRPPRIFFSQSGKKLEVLARDTGIVTVTLTVSDGINDTVKFYHVVVKNKPIVEILRPKRYAEDEFVNNRFILYSYHKTFKFNDISSVVNLNRSVNLAGDDDFSRWSKIIPELDIITSANEDHIGIKVLKFNKSGEDSVSNYSEKFLPYLSSQYYWQLSDESALFNLEYLGKKPYRINKPIKDSLPRLYRYTFSVYENNNSIETIKIPNTRYFKVVVYDHGIENSTDFLIQFKKISRFRAVFNASFFAIYANNTSYPFTLNGLGCEYLLFDGVSIEGNFGTSTSLGFSSPVLPYSKLAADLNLFSWYHFIKASFTINDMIRKTYSFSTDGAVHYSNYRSRVGCGASLESGFSKSEFSPLSEGLFFVYYPPGYQLSGFKEFGLTFKFSFAK